MSPRRWFQGALLLAALGMTAAWRPAGAPRMGFRVGRSLAGDTVVVARVGGNLAGRDSDVVDVPITVDLTGAPGVRLGGYRLTLRYNPNVLSWEGGSPGTFAPPSVNDQSPGMLLMAAIQPSGADSVVTLGVGHFRVLSDTGASDITVAFDEMSGVAPDFKDLRPYLTVVNATFCHASGRWGDVDGDGQANSRDALVALSQVVGITLDTMRLDTLYTDTAGVHTAWRVLMRPGLADVDADGQVTSRDALIIMSYAVGLPVPGFRIGLAAAAGACGSGIGLTLALSPDTLELQTGQEANAVVSARDAAGHPAALSGATWTSSNTVVAGVTSPGFGITARDPGIAVLTVQLGAGYRASMVVKVIAHRTQWYADALRSQAAIQTGSQAFPLAFIGDALDLAYDGDTVHVAPGIYEETVSSDVAVTILGDTATDGSRPTIDARGYPGYDPLYLYNEALSFSTPAGRLELQNLRIVGGGANVESRGLVVRNVRVEAPAASDAFYATRYYGSGGLPSDTRFNVLIDRLDIAGYVNRGIYIDGADSVIVDSSTSVRDSLNGGTCYNAMALDQGGIVAQVLTYAKIRGNTVINSPCSAIRVSQRSGRTEIGQNHVQGALLGGIAADGDTVALDRNVVLHVGVGIYVRSNLSPLRHVSSFADTVGTAVGSAFRVDTALVVDVDSLDIDNAYRGVQLTGGVRLTLTHSRIQDPAGFVGGNGVRVCGLGASLFSRGNRITNAGSAGIIANDCGGYPDTLVSVGDTLLTANASGIWSGASYTRIDNVRIDSTVVQYADGIFAQGGHVLLVNAPFISRVALEGIEGHQVDTVRVTGGSITQTGGGGIWSDAAYTRIDNVRIDSTIGQYADGIFAQGGHVLLVNAPLISRVAWQGIEGHQVDTVRVTGGSITQSGSNGVWVSEGLRLVADGVTVDGSGASYAYGVGVGAWHTRYTEVLGSSVLRSRWTGVNVSTADSVLVTGSSVRENGTGAAPGIYLEYVTDSARIKGNTIENNGTGIQTVYGSPLVLDSNRVAGNTASGWFSNDSSAGGSATRNLFLNNGWGVVVHPVSGGSTPPILSLRRNSFGGNTFGAVAKNGSISTIDADSNYWGDPLGPNCRFTVGDPHCPATTTGDTILSPGVTFFPWLASADPEVAAVSALMLAQRQVRSARIPPSASPSTPPDMQRLRAHAVRPEERRDGSGRSAAQGPPPEDRLGLPQGASRAAATHALGTQARRPMSWQRGRVPRPARIHHPAS